MSEHFCMDNTLAKLYKSSKTVLTTRDIALIWQETNPNNLKAKISYYVKHGALTRLTRGVFAKDKEYNKRELATSIYVPSYVSFETVLRDAGLIFQHYDTIFIASSRSKTITINKHTYTFRKLKDSVLYNPTGITTQDNFNIATSARAFLDTIYLFPGYYFDNLGPINWELCLDLVKIYDNRQLTKRLNKYRKQYAK